MNKPKSYECSGINKSPGYLFDSYVQVFLICRRPDENSKLPGWLQLESSEHRRIAALLSGTPPQTGRTAERLADPALPVLAYQGKGVSREDVSALLKLGSVALGYPPEVIGPHSLRKGATALYAATGHMEFVKRFGGWKSEAVHAYLYSNLRRGQAHASSMLHSKPALQPLEVRSCVPARHVLGEFGEVTTHVQTCKLLERDHINFLHMFQVWMIFGKAMFDVALMWPLLQNQSRKAAVQDKLLQQRLYRRSRTQVC